MGFLNRVKCTHCGRKTAPMARRSLGDGSSICNHCQVRIPEEALKMLPDYDYASFAQLREFADKVEPVLAKCFHQTHSFFGIHLDADNGIFFVREYGQGKPFYLRTADVRSFEMHFRGKKYKARNTHLDCKVTGEVHCIVSVNDPIYVFRGIVACGMEADGETDPLRLQFSYDNPEGMDEFIQIFNQTVRRTIEEKRLTEGGKRE